MTILLNNRYLIVQTIGTGEWCSTFLAQDTWVTPYRWCVVKEFGPAVSTLTVRRRVQEQFRRSATTLTELSKRSNQLSSVYSHFARSGWLYLVREWVEGQSLQEKLQVEGPFSEALVQAILIRLLGILDYLHSKKIVHGAITAENIILRTRDSEPILINFDGFKQAMKLGTTSPPKPIRRFSFSKRGQLDDSEDLYALGLTAIHLLTGILPADLEQMKSKRLRWQGYALNISPKLVAVLNKATEAHPRDRYKNPREMLRDLWAKGSLVEETRPPASPPSKLRKKGVSHSLASQSSLQEWIRALLPGSLIGVIIVILFAWLKSL